jgi:hypothetical protein
MKVHIESYRYYNWRVHFHIPGNLSIWCHKKPNFMLSVIGQVSLLLVFLINSKLPEFLKAHLHFWHRLTTSVAEWRGQPISFAKLIYTVTCVYVERVNAMSQFPSWAELNSSDIFRTSNHERRHYRDEWRHGRCRGEPDSSSSWS